MDQQAQRGRSPSAGHQHSHISHSPSPAPYQANDPAIGLGVALDQQSFPGSNAGNLDAFGNNSNIQNGNGPNNFLNPQQQQAAYGQQNVSDSTLFDPNANFSQPLPVTGADSQLSFNSQSQPDYLSPNLNDGDFSLFPAGGQGDNYNAPLFEQPTLNPNDINSMTSPQPQHSPTPPHLFQPDAHQPGSAHQSPSFNQHQFSSPPGGAQHSRTSSLVPEAALMSNQLGDWSQPQFQGHRRSPSAHSEVSSVSPSPNLVSADSFDVDPSGHSPLQRPSDGALYQDVLGIGSFSISDPPYSQGRSPSHSPAISPRIMPQQLAAGKPQGYGMPMPGAYGDPSAVPGLHMQGEAFPNLGHPGDPSQMAPPSINIDYAPTNARQGVFGPGKPHIDQDSLTPPERGRQRARQRAVTDPSHPGGVMLGRQGSSHSPSPSPSLGSDLGPRSDVSRSLSPFDRDSASPNRRRQSTSAVPNNVIALRLADPENHTGQDTGSAKRAQKHPATFQCTLCPKRFTRAYNLRSHLRTHTDERPFVCTVCGKAFARQHDRKRHESLHSGEKKFVCKGDLKAGGQWGCGRRFARADALGRHFRSEAGRVCIKPLLDEEMLERQRVWQEQRMQQNVNMAPQPVIDPTTGFPMDASGQYSLPAALIQQYPALAQMNWSGPDMSGGLDDELSGRSSFDASDFDDGDDGGYVSGPGAGYGEGGMGQNFGEMGYNSDFGGR